MTDALTRAHRDGIPLAALTASEATIYGRFGFGIATRRRGVTLATLPAPSWHREVEPRMALVLLDADALTIRDEVFARIHASTRGIAIPCPHTYTTFLSGAWDVDKEAPVSGLRVAVHTDAEGAPDGVVSYVMNEADESVQVRDLLVVDAEAELALWQFLGSIDLVKKVTWRNLSPTSLVGVGVDRPATGHHNGGGGLHLVARAGRPRRVGRARVGRRRFGRVQRDRPDGLRRRRLACDRRRPHSRRGRLDAAAVRVDATALASLYMGLVDASTRVFKSSLVTVKPSVPLNCFVKL